MGTYDGVGHMRLCSALRKANKISKANQAGSSSSSSSHAGLISDNSEVVQLLVRASEQYAQVSWSPPPPPPVPLSPPHTKCGSLLHLTKRMTLKYKHASSSAALASCLVSMRYQSQSYWEVIW